MKINLEKIYLAAAGFTLVAVGSFIGLTPELYFSAYNPDAVPSPGFLSELRGMGGGLLIFGLLACCAIKDERIAETAISSVTLIFIAFGCFRMLALAIDGMPELAVLAAMIVELLLGLSGLSLIRRRSAAQRAGERTAMGWYQSSQEKLIETSDAVPDTGGRRLGTGFHWNVGRRV